jgi:hypothetical protein
MQSVCRPGSDRGVSLNCGFSLRLALSCTFTFQRLSTVSGIFGVLAEQSRNSDYAPADVGGASGRDRTGDLPLTREPRGR